MQPQIARFTHTKIPASDRHREYYEYTVSGTGAFPVDMLRYDSCYPARQDDAIQLSPHTRRSPGEVYHVTLHSCHPPTDARWASFGWKVNR